METKYQIITRLYEQALGEITEPKKWQDFLKSASYNYKCRFDEQVLIFAQKPEATAVLEIGKWNRKFNRWVNKGATGIAVFSGTNVKENSLKYFFDISDTNEVNNAIQVPIWHVVEPFENAVIETIESVYGELESNESLARAIISGSKNACEDYFSDYFVAVSESENQQLALIVDNDQHEKEFKELLANSVAFMILERCGITATDYYNQDDFNYINNFKEKDKITAIGIATSNIAEKALSEIAVTVKAIQKEYDTFEKIQRIEYTGGNETVERSVSHGQNNVHHGGRLQSAELNSSGGRRGNPFRQIRNKTQEIFGRKSQSAIQPSADILQAERTPSGDRKRSLQHDGTTRVTDGGSAGSHRATERIRPDALGAKDEQHSTLGRGNSSRGTDLYLTNELPTFEEQLNTIVKAEVIETSALTIPQEDIDLVLQNDNEINILKMRIYSQFLKNEDEKENIQFLIKEYGIGGSYPAVKGNEICETHNKEGINIFYKSKSKPNETVHLTWTSVEKRIKELIKLDRYLNLKEQEHLNVFDSNIAIQKEKTAPEDTSKQYQFSLGGTVYLGANEYEIMHSDNKNVSMFDKKFPISKKEFTNETLAEILKENTYNDHLLKSVNENRSDLFFVSEDAKSIKWMYYNPQSVSGGQYVTNVFTFDDIKKAQSETITYGEFFDFISSGCNQVIADAGTKWFKNAQDEFSLKPTFSGCSYKSMIKLYHLLDNLDIDKYEVEDKDSETIIPSWTKKAKTKSNGFILHPEIADSERRQYVILNNELGVGTEKEKFKNNLNAIRVLKACESENRFASHEEQEVLSKYVGFGGLAKAFDNTNTLWSAEYAELSDALSPDEYESAKESTLTAFYTPPIVIDSMYKALENMGFSRGNILEPSCGIGNFIGMIPQSMQNSKFYGVELDSITGRIAMQLYQKTSIAIDGYEKTEFPDSFFDVAIGNVPFGQFKVLDKKYDKYNWLIHDYFFGRTLDKIRQGGIIAFITSKGTLDKENSAVRRYLAQRAELLGAIRLPNNTFAKNANTEVTSDIIFLQKRDRIIDARADWVMLGKDKNGLKINRYFIDNPEMILGEMKEVSGKYGPQTECIAKSGQDIGTLLNNAMRNIHAEISEYQSAELSDDENTMSIPADPTVRNFSYTMVDGELYFRENSIMTPVATSETAKKRIKGLIKIRNSVRTLIELQTDNYSDSDIKAEQLIVSRLYDSFTKEYGLISSRANSTAFSNDSSYCLLLSLEVIDENGNFVRKADIFTKRTIKPHITVEKVDTSSEALIVSLSEKAAVNLPYMSQLTNKTVDELVEDLNGIIFRVPDTFDNENNPIYQNADEYLSGNVRVKLSKAKRAAEKDSFFRVNVDALEKVQPPNLSASEIDVRLGATWIPQDIVQKFIFELLDTPKYLQHKIKVHHSKITSDWAIEGKSYDRDNINSSSIYGTSRINAYKIIEETLNLKDVRIFDYGVDNNGKQISTLNKNETSIVRAKQELIKEQFVNWIWKDAAHREILTVSYNKMFNSTKNREYDGSHIKFSGINPEITLEKHQVNAIAHILLGGNTLLAHVVGAGKTFEMVAAAMESKRLGLCSKSLFVVPNHITEQWASEFLQLYPAANILVATKKDFETKNRKRFCARISTGDYDAVIIGHSQFEKIPMSIERQKIGLEKQLNEIIRGIEDAKRSQSESFTVKQMVKTKKNIERAISSINDQSRKDDVVTFEELGIDRLFVDESHNYKNLFMYTKMRNVSGIAQSDAQKSSDMFLKCRYMDELTGGKGIVFATGTPISNSIVEMYTIQRYLQYDILEKIGLQHFDAWASTFGETVTSIELAPEGSGYRTKTRFAKFYNLPELMAMFKDCADIQTADMLNLKVPKVNYHNVSVEPSEMQTEMVNELSLRADKVRNRMVNARDDNMLLITNDGRKIALDQRLINEMLPDFEGSKVNACAENVYSIWEESKQNKSTQLVFCDLSTPKKEGVFSVYTDVRDKLIAKGVSKDEIQFIHTADNEIKKKELFAKVKKGDVRVLLGSTSKLGAGTNVQKKLIALHNVDCPWRPSDLEQRAGRIIRQGNENSEVNIFRYVTKNTFDAYLYQLVESKQRFISQIMTSKSPVRSAEDIDEIVLSYAEIKMLATGNPLIKEKMDLDIEVAKLKTLRQNHLSERYSLEDKILLYFPKEIKRLDERIIGLQSDIEIVQKNISNGGDKFSTMTINGVTYTEKAQAGMAILELCKSKKSPELSSIGAYRGFEMSLEYEVFTCEYKVTLKNNLSYKTTLSSDVIGNITRVDNVINGIESKLINAKELLENTKKQLYYAKENVKKEFSKESELKIKIGRLDELNILLNMDNKVIEIDENMIDVSDSNDGKTKNIDYER